MNKFGRRSAGDRRSAVREPALLSVVFATVTKSHAVALVDVSATGARLRGADLPGADQLVELRIDDLALFGLVRWTSRNECGVVFEHQLAAADVSFLRKKVEQMAGVPLEFRAAYDDWTVGTAR